MNDIKRALLSVYSKSPTFDNLVRRLDRLGYALIASGGTYKHIKENLGRPVTDVAEISHCPPALDHRVATLVPSIHGGLLANLDNEAHVAELNSLGWLPIHLVVCTFYPLEQTIREDPQNTSAIIEKIDIGGPTLVRSALKGDRIVLVNESDFIPVVELMESGRFDTTDVLNLHRKAVRCVADYVATEADFRQDRYDRHLGI